LCWALTWEAPRKTQARRYLQRNRGVTFKSAAWFHAVRDHASEQRFRTFFRVSRSTFSKLRDVLWAHARPIIRRRRGGAQLALDLQLAITLYRLGHYGNACSVDAVADLFSVSVGAVIKSIRRVVKALSMIAPEHIKWPSRSCRAASSRFAADGYGFQGCIGATDSTTFTLADQPALRPWSSFDRKSMYSLNGIIKCDWNYNVINFTLWCTGAAPDTFVQSTADWHQHPAIYFSAGEYLLGDKGMLYTSRVIGPFKEPDCTSPAERNFNYQLARLRDKSEHTISILKGRWSSLKEVRVALATDKQFSFAMGWVVACCVLHNFCVKEGDAFPEEALSDESPCIGDAAGGRCTCAPQRGTGAHVCIYEAEWDVQSECMSKREAVDIIIWTTLYKQMNTRNATAPQKLAPRLS